jgi:hypothetical protein
MAYIANRMNTAEYENFYLLMPIAIASCTLCLVVFFVIACCFKEIPKTARRVEVLN